MIMGPLVQETIAQPGRVQPERLNWAENPAVKQLLDALVTIIAAEYVRTVKANPAEFSVNGDPK